MKPKDQEKRTGALFEQLLQTLGETAIVKSGGRTNKWKGASGYEHGIDVSIEFSDEILLVECKHWDTPVTPDAALTLLGRLIDIRPLHNKSVGGALVTNREPGPGAMKICQRHGISCDRVESEHDYAVTLRDRKRVGKLLAGTVTPAGELTVRGIGSSDQFQFGESAEVVKKRVE